MQDHKNFSEGHYAIISKVLSWLELTELPQQIYCLCLFSFLFKNNSVLKHFIIHQMHKDIIRRYN